MFVSFRIGSNISLAVFQQENLLHSRWFYQKFILKLNMVNFNMYTKVKRS